MTMTITYIENLQKAIPETSDLWDIWPEWHGIMIWPEKTKTKTIREHPERAIKEIFTYETMTGTKTKLFIKSVTLDPPVAKGLIVIITFIGYQHKLETQKKRTCENKGQISSNWLDEAPSKVTSWRNEDGCEFLLWFFQDSHQITPLLSSTSVVSCCCYSCPISSCGHPR